MGYGKSDKNSGPKGKTNIKKLEIYFQDGSLPKPREMTPEQRAEYKEWPPEKRQQYLESLSHREKIERAILGPFSDFEKMVDEIKKKFGKPRTRVKRLLYNP